MSTDDYLAQEEPTEQLPRPITLLYMGLNSDDKIATHAHPWGQLVYALKGILSVRSPMGSYIVPPQRAVWIPPQRQHSVTTRQGATLASVYIEEQEAQTLLNQCQVIAVSNLLKELIAKAVTFPTEYEWNGRQGRLLRTLRDQIAEAEIVPLHLPSPMDSRLTKLCDELQSNPGDNRRLEEWAILVGASSRTLARLFQTETGMSFRSWRQLLRLQTSLQLLSDGLTVTRVALELGYDSTSAFIAMFQKHLGLSPGEYSQK